MGINAPHPEYGALSTTTVPQRRAYRPWKEFNVSTFEKNGWVCLVTPEELQAQRNLQDAQNRGSWMEGGLLRASLWRQISITATPELVTFDLGVPSNATTIEPQGGRW